MTIISEMVWVENGIIQKGIGNNQVDRIADAKVPSNIFEKEVHIEEKSSIHKEEEVAGLPTWKQEILTKKVVKVVLQPREELTHLDVPKEGWQVTLAEKRDVDFSFIQGKSSTSYDFESSSLHLQQIQNGEEFWKPMVAREKLRKVAEEVKGVIEENKTTVVVLVLPPVGKFECVCIELKNE